MNPEASPPILRHGYYAAKAKERHGDMALSMLAETYWTDLGHNAPSVVDHVGCWTRDLSGVPTVRIVALDLFSPKLRVVVRDRSGAGWVPGT